MFYKGTHLDPGPDDHRVEPMPVDEGTPRLRNIALSNVIAESNDGGYITGLPEMPIEGVSFDNCRITSNKPCFAARVNGLTFHNVQFICKEGPAAIVCEDIKDLDITGLKYSQPAPGSAAIELTGIEGGYIRNCSTAPGTDAFIRLRGKNNRDIIIGANNTATATRQIALEDGATTEAIKKM
jgi:hypothetical protein